MPKHAVILTGHFPQQKRRASIPWLCHHLRREGWHVTMVTVGYSWLSKWLGDRRFEGLQQVPRTGVTRHDDGFVSVMGYAPVHPVSTGSRVIDRLLEPVHGLFARYWRPRVSRIVAAADLVVLESGAPVLLADVVRRAAPDAALVYKIADDVRVLGLPGFVARAELHHAPLFDRISVASPQLAARFGHLASVQIDPLGVPKALFDRALPDPYADRAGVEAVCAGTTLLDLEAVCRMADLRPGWRFHIIGRMRQHPREVPPNLILHGECPFEETAGRVRHADIGLAPYLDRPGIGYQSTHSNRILMYRYFGLPVIGPARLKPADLPSLCAYVPGDPDSLRAALHRAEKTLPAPEREAIPDWSDFADRIAATPAPAQPRRPAPGLRPAKGLGERAVT